MFAPTAQGGHFWQTQAMARSLGISLTDAMADGQLDAKTYTRMLAQCGVCPSTSDCNAWMAAPDVAAETAPAFCRIKRYLDYLGARARK